MSGFTREVQMPRTRRDGLANFVQIIINQIEAGHTREALLFAVDLLNDINTGAYDDAMADAKGYSAIIREKEAEHAAAIITAHELGYADGVAAEKARLAAILGLITALDPSSQEGRAS